MNKFYIPLLAVRERQHYVEELEKQLPIDQVFYDDMHRGPLWSTIRALESAQNRDVSHIMFIQDDCIPCNNLIDICEHVIEAHPDNVIALHPFDFLDSSLSPNPDSDSPYYTAKFISGLGIILPFKYREDYLKYCYRSRSWYEDVTMYDYCQDRKITILQTIPALVQHRGGHSIEAPQLEDDWRISAYFYRNPTANWDSKEINILNYTGIPQRRNARKVDRLIIEN